MLKPGPKSGDVLQRLLSHGTRVGECLEWQGYRNPKGYGYAYDAKRKAPSPVHRMVWRLIHGDIASGDLILHRCDNPACFEPSHLFAGTPHDNMADMLEKGRCGVMKLSASDVIKIREMHAKGMSAAAIARHYGRAASTIQNVVRRKTWTNV